MADFTEISHKCDLPENVRQPNISSNSQYPTLVPLSKDKTSSSSLDINAQQFVPITSFLANSNIPSHLNAPSSVNISKSQNASVKFSALPKTLPSLTSSHLSGFKAQTRPTNHNTYPTAQRSAPPIEPLNTKQPCRSFSLSFPSDNYSNSVYNAAYGNCSVSSRYPTSFTVGSQSRLNPRNPLGLSYSNYDLKPPRSLVPSLATPLLTTNEPTVEYSLYPNNSQPPMKRYSSFPTRHSYHIPNAENASTFYLLRQDLFKKSSNCFSGEPHRFHSWLNSIENIIRDIPLEPWDVLTIFHANTSGKPQKLIETHMDIGGANPQHTLDNVWQMLQENFGSSTKIAHSLFNKVKAFPLLKNLNDSDKLRELISLCQLILCNIPVAQELQTFNLAHGTSLIWNKLPPFLKSKWCAIVSEYQRWAKSSYVDDFKIKIKSPK